ncbi:MAG: NAD(P)/FAD-dependent oxidoreductase [Eubacteriaceae bacterium]|nr:NAD(P)/FAD-dependent oxidoreductase [Eubacteriaceae bacterium]
MYDVIIIGCGIVGASAAFELSKYDISIAVLEKDNDVAEGATKANSAIVHAGYDPTEGSLMAKYNIKGAAMMKDIAEQFDVIYKQCGAFVLAFSDEDMLEIEKLLKRGKNNGVAGIEILSAQKTLDMEPKLSRNVKAALNAPTSAIIDPWDLCTAYAEMAVRNGVELKLSAPVMDIIKLDDRFIVKTDKKIYEAKYIINAAGTHADVINDMVCNHKFTIVPTKGEYYLLDKKDSNVINRTIFQCPNEKGKGVLVTRTVHGNLLIGPDAQAQNDRDDTSVEQHALDYIKEASLRSVPDIAFRSVIRSFAGVRANSDIGEFVIGQAEETPGFINLSAIKSPGLTSAPAIGLDAVDILKDAGLKMEKKNYYQERRKVVRFDELSRKEKNELIASNPLYGKIVCRCEHITEGEIIDAINGVIPALSIDSIKKRTRAGMGRCQGGFCGPKIAQIIADQTGASLLEVLQGRSGSEILISKTKQREVL